VEFFVSHLVTAAKDPMSAQPDDFHFLNGEWTIQNRRQVDATTQQWEEFPGEATCWSILSGTASIEELRIPAKEFFGMGLRLLDKEKGVWNDYWVNARNGKLNLPPQQGRFENGVGLFLASELYDGKEILVRGVWDGITSDSCRWTQAVSYDQGVTWQPNWFMEWTRKRT
jgi:hypothetical protein